MNRRQLSVLLLAAALTVVALFDWVDRPAQGYYESAFKRALVTFALARTLNGVISVIQGTELAIEPAGVGVVLSPGEIVDPINDLIERFSWVMLLSTTSLGVQNILMDISQWWGVRALVVIALVAFALTRTAKSRRTRLWMARLFVACLMVRFIMPSMVIFSHAVYEVFMADEAAQSSIIVEDTATAVAEMAEEDKEREDESWMGAAKAWFSETVSQLDVKARMEVYAEKLNQSIEHLLKLAAMFIFQTIVLPMGFLWAVMRGASRLVNTR